MRAAIVLGMIAAVTFSSGGCKRATEWAQRHAAEHAKPVAEEPGRVERAAPVLTGPGIAPGRYRIVDVRVLAEPLHRGRPWDNPKTANPAPDLRATISVDGKQIGDCDGPDDSFELRCRPELELEIDRATLIALTVVDRDTIVDDQVGTARLEDFAHWGVGIDLSLTTSGELRAASIVLEEVPTWWALQGARIVGVGIGLALGGLILALWRGRLLRPRSATPAPVLAPSVGAPTSHMAILSEPILLAALGLASVEVLCSLALWGGALPPAGWAEAIPCALGAAAVVLVGADVVHTRQARRRHVGLVVVLVGGLVIQLTIYVIKLIALTAIVLAIGSLAL